VRAFLAVPADPGWQEAIRCRLDPVRSRWPRASWTRPESWHLTIRFLGEVSDEFAANAREAFRCLQQAPATNVRYGGPELIPSARRARVLGVRIEADAACEALARQSEEAARRSGLSPESRPFRPHLTLARCREPWPTSALEAYIAELSRWELPLWEIREVVLYRSVLDAAGAVHTPLIRFALGAEGET
jgi:RNA 2',3'-cyclic 3'-phosphodiesterase